MPVRSGKLTVGAGLVRRLPKLRPDNRKGGHENESGNASEGVGSGIRVEAAE